MAHFVVLGKPYQMQRLAEAAEAGEYFNWDIHKDAQTGDQVLFYVTKPSAAFVTIGVVASNPKLQTEGRRAGHYMAKIDHLKMLSRALVNAEIRRVFPTWDYMKQPHQSHQVPEGVVPELEKLVAAATTLVADDEGDYDVALGSYVEFKSKTQRKVSSGMIKEIDDEKDTYVIVRDEDLKIERIGQDQVKAVIVDSEETDSADTKAEVDDDEYSDVEVGSHVTFKSQTQRRLMTGIVKEINEDAETVVIRRDKDGKDEQIGYAALKTLLE